MPATNDNDKLDHLLMKWECPLAPDPNLEREVWRRIAADEGRRSHFGILSGWFEHTFTGPAVAAGFFLLAMLAGIGAAEFRLQQRHEIAKVPSAERAYFESINPVALARHIQHSD